MDSQQPSNETSQTAPPGGATGSPHPVALAELLVQRMAPLELFRSQFEATHMAQLPAVQIHCAARAALGAHDTANRIVTRLVGLLSQLARRHLNEIRVLPAPASFAGQCLDHLVAHSEVLRNPSPPARDLLEIALKQEHRTWFCQNPLALGSLSSAPAEGVTAALKALCHTLTREAELYTDIAVLMAESYDSFFRSLGAWASQALPVTPWRARTGPGSTAGLGAGKPLGEAHEDLIPLEELRTLLVGNRTHGPRLADLVLGRPFVFATGLGKALARLEELLNSLEQWDHLWVSHQMTTPASVHGLIENTLVIQALCERLRLTGESASDVEQLAHSLVTYAESHKVNCLAMLESEIQELAPTLAPQAITRALRHVKFEDPMCPVSVRHKNNVLKTLDAVEALLAHARNTDP